ncbi:hypothetical protein MP638_004922 [Amoeboaphelidium occidentale]|nr:hypothetical protein MP638_004922 [Amoeboaphelidium occidentale]
MFRKLPLLTFLIIIISINVLFFPLNTLQKKHESLRILSKRDLQWNPPLVLSFKELLKNVAVKEEEDKTVLLFNGTDDVILSEFDGWFKYEVPYFFLTEEESEDNSYYKENDVIKKMMNYSLLNDDDNKENIETVLIVSSSAPAPAPAAPTVMKIQKRDSLRMSSSFQQQQQQQQQKEPLYKVVEGVLFLEYAFVSEGIFTALLGSLVFLVGLLCSLCCIMDIQSNQKFETELRNTSGIDGVNSKKNK